MQKFHTEEQRQLETSLQDNRYWLSYLSTKLQNGEDINSITGQRERIAKVTAADVKRTANDYVSGKNLIRFILLPENAKAQ